MNQNKAKEVKQKKLNKSKKTKKKQKEIERAKKQNKTVLRNQNKIKKRRREGNNPEQ